MKVITVCQGIVVFLDEGVGTDAITIDFSMALDRVPHDRLLRKLAASGVDSRVVENYYPRREFLVGRTQRVRIGAQ